MTSLQTKNTGKTIFVQNIAVHFTQIFQKKGDLEHMLPSIQYSYSKNKKFCCQGNSVGPRPL